MQRTLLTAFVLLACTSGLVVSACGSDPTGSSDDASRVQDLDASVDFAVDLAADTDATDLVTADVLDAEPLPSGALGEQLCLPLAEVVCERAMACDCTVRNGLSDAQAWARCLARSAGECHAQVLMWSSFGEETDAMLEAGELVVDPDGVQSCTDAYERRVQPCAADGTVYGEAAFLLSFNELGCERAVATTEALDGPCTVRSDEAYACASGQGFCADATCQPAAGDGEECEGDTQRHCGPGLSCQDEVCEPVGGQGDGDACQDDSVCRAGLWCNGGRCEPLPEDGERCNDFGCQPGHECVGSSLLQHCLRVLHDDCLLGGLSGDDPDFVGCGRSSQCMSPEPPRCLPRLEPGTVCGPGDRCRAGSICALQNDGEVRCASGCEQDEDCEADRVCVFEQCEGERPGLGEDCDVDSDTGDCAEGLWCLPGTPDGYQCSDELPGLDEPCVPQTSECAEGRVCHNETDTCVEPPGRDGDCGAVHPSRCEVGSWCQGGTCAALLEEGEPCPQRTGCAEGLFCVFDDERSELVCAGTPPGEGELCSAVDQACSEGLVCARFAFGTHRCFRPPAAEGDPCPRRNSPGFDICPDETFCGCEDDECEPLVCLSFRDIGDRCDASWECGPDAWCFDQQDGDRRCEPLRGAGEPCENFQEEVCAPELFCGGPGYVGTCELDACVVFLDY